MPLAAPPHAEVDRVARPLALAAPADQLVHGDRDDDHGAGDERAPLDIDTEEQDPGGDDLDDQGADDGAQMVPRPPDSGVPPMITAATTGSR